MKVKSGFTLAETLITLTIIGVVAAMTIPTLMTKYQDHVLKTGIKKAISVTNQAIAMIPISEGCPAGDYECAGVCSLQYVSADYQRYTECPNLFNLLKKQLRIAKECGNNESGCGPDSYDVISNGVKVQEFPWFKRYDSFLTTDGMAYSFDEGTFLIDINGEKGPNKTGKDIINLGFETEPSNGHLIFPGYYYSEGDGKRININDL